MGNFIGGLIVGIVVSVGILLAIRGFSRKRATPNEIREEFDKHQLRLKEIEEWKANEKKKIKEAKDSNDPNKLAAVANNLLKRRSKME